MAAYTIEPSNRVAGSIRGKGIGPVPPGEEWSVDVRVCAVGGVDGIIDLEIQKTDGTNRTYRHRAKTVVSGDGSFDLEYALMLTAGYELWDRSGNADVAISYTGTKRYTA